MQEQPLPKLILTEVSMDEVQHLVSNRAIQGETVLLNMGPQHPSTHGVLRLLLELDGEEVKEMGKLVYCGGCRFYRARHCDLGSHEWCTYHPPRTESSYLRPTYIYSAPSEMNENNNCNLWHPASLWDKLWQ